MKYAVVTIDWLTQHGLLAIPTMRKSKDGSKVILHDQYLTPYKDEEFPIYYFDSPELNALLASEEWSWSEEEAPEGVPSLFKWQHRKICSMLPKQGFKRCL